MKPIKFDLKLSDGTTTLRTLDDLEENLSPALFEHFHSGKLAKWLRVRKLEELADNVEALRTQHIDDKNELDVKLFKNLCEIFVSEVDENDAREAVADFKAVEPSVGNSNDEEVEQLKAEIEALKAEIEQVKSTAEKGQSEELEELRNLCRYYQTNLSDVMPRLNQISLVLSLMLNLRRFQER
jgi:hypothetical protein